MGSDDFFKRKALNDKDRKAGNKESKPSSFLIVSEGEKTEPLYFDGLASYINKKYDSNIDTKPYINTQGEGKCTVSLVLAAIEYDNRSKIKYMQRWVIFDKDDFSDFDEAIQLAQANGIRIAWSNQSFEYWLYLHFYYCASALHRDVWVEKLNDIFIKRGISTEGYEKNNSDIFKHMTRYGSLKNAVQYAKRVELLYKDTDCPSSCDPCTKVHHLINELKPFMEELFK